MRTEKFDNSKSAWDSDDIKNAFEHNYLSELLPLIDVILAEVPGEADGPHWYWILQMKDNTFAAATGWCDYTGWDCQSGASIQEGFASAPEAVAALNPEYENRPVKDVLLGQLDETIPFALCPLP